MSISCNSLKSQADNPSAYNIVVSLDLNANMVQLIIVGDFITHNLNILILNLIYLFLVLYGISFGARTIYVFDGWTMCYFFNSVW